MDRRELLVASGLSVLGAALTGCRQDEEPPPDRQQVSYNQTGMSYVLGDPTHLTLVILGGQYSRMVVTSMKQKGPHVRIRAGTRDHCPAQGCPEAITSIGYELWCVLPLKEPATLDTLLLWVNGVPTPPRPGSRGRLPSRERRAVLHAPPTTDEQPTLSDVRPGSPALLAPAARPSVRPTGR